MRIKSNHVVLFRTPVVLAGLFVALGARGAHAQNGTKQFSPGMTAEVSGSVEETVARIKKMVAASGMMVMGEIHQGQILKMTGLEVQSESLFVGNPNVGKKLFTAEPGAGIAVPIRINIYRDAGGRTVVRYVPPSVQLREFANTKMNMVTRMLDKKLGDMVAMLPR